MTNIQPELYVFDVPGIGRLVLARGVDAAEIMAALMAGEVDAR